MIYTTEVLNLCRQLDLNIKTIEPVLNAINESFYKTHPINVHYHIGKNIFCKIFCGTFSNFNVNIDYEGLITITDDNNNRLYFDRYVSDDLTDRPFVKALLLNRIFTEIIPGIVLTSKLNKVSIDAYISDSIVKENLRMLFESIVITIEKFSEDYEIHIDDEKTGELLNIFTINKK